MREIGWPAILARLCLTAAVLLAGAVHASAGLAVVRDAPPAHQQVYDYLKDHAPGMVEPLLPHSVAEPAETACPAGYAPRAHGILIGASTPGWFFPELKGPDNDIALLAASLEARGVERERIAFVSGPSGGRERLAAVLSASLADLGCGDRVIFYFGGHAARTVEFFRNIIDEDRADDLIATIDNAALYGAENSVTEGLRRARSADMFMVLNGQAEEKLEVFSASDLSDFVSAVRNRHADVAVILDTNYASMADIAARQTRAGHTATWSLETAGESTELAQPAPVPNPGHFAAFYSSTEDSSSIEIGFDNPEGTKTQYGIFTFALANAIQNAEIVTVRALAESLKKLPGPDGQRPQRYRVEASDAEMVLFGDASRILPKVDSIVITSPTPKRGGTVLKVPEVQIEGRVNWSSAVRAVLVGGRAASLRGSDGFAYKAALKAGLNSLEVVALTSDGRTHEKKLEFFYEGDMAALEGDGKRYAVIIANQNYDRSASGFDRLSTPFADADALAEVLTRKYGFVTETTRPDGRVVPLMLKDATGRDIERVLYEVGLVAGAKDTVLIFYAGHGIYEERTTIAFWVPIDAEDGVPISYLSASSISEAVQRMQANKVIVISDSCFSGALLRGGPPAGANAAEGADRQRALMRLAERKSRILISSGNNEPVEDLGGGGHSVFARALLTGLDDMDMSAFSSRELFDRYILPLVAANADQEPQYRPIEKVGHEGGDLVFVRGGD